MTVVVVPTGDEGGQLGFPNVSVNHSARRAPVILAAGSGAATALDTESRQFRSAVAGKRWSARHGLEGTSG